MLDRHATRLIKPAIDAVAAALVRWRLGADAVTLIGFALGLAAAAAIAQDHVLAGLGLLLASRLCDGLDGAIARLTQPTDRGGFLDIALDFVFYSSIPLAFAIAHPAANALPAAVLLAAFIGTGSSFLAYAALAAKSGLKSEQYPDKSFYFLGGLTEATETLALFVAMCLFPSAFGTLAYGFAALCAITTATRIVWGYRHLP